MEFDARKATRGVLQDGYNKFEGSRTFDSTIRSVRSMLSEFANDFVELGTKTKFLRLKSWSS